MIEPFIEDPSAFMGKGSMSKALSELTTPTGTASGRLDQDIRKLSRDVGILIVDTYEQFAKVLEVCDTVTLHLNKAGEALSQLSQITESISSKFNYVCELNKYENFGKIAEIYQSLADTFQVQGGLLAQESICFSKDIKMMFDFDLKEIEGLEDVQLVHLAYGEKKHVLE